MKKTGIIIKGIGGFYYVAADGSIYECKARGSFRNRKIVPLVGDKVQISVNDNAENTIDEIFERKNFLVRPPLANIDTLIIVASAVDPDFNCGVVDMLIAIAESKNINPVIVITKIDLSDDYKEYYELYKNAGFDVICMNNLTGEGAADVRKITDKSVCAFSGNTGAGKSTLINNMYSMDLKTGETSKKLGRGKHTTRHCELIKTKEGFVADTPGFSFIDFQRCEDILKEDLPFCFREFLPYVDKCRFIGCSHTCDLGCAVIKAVSEGKISKSRHNSYVNIYNELKGKNQWKK